MERSALRARCAPPNSGPVHLASEDKERFPSSGWHPPLIGHALTSRAKVWLMAVRISQEMFFVDTFTIDCTHCPEVPLVCFKPSGSGCAFSHCFPPSNVPAKQSDCILKCPGRASATLVRNQALQQVLGWEMTCVSLSKSMMQQQQPR